MPIIKSLMDMDFYKFTMGQVVFHGFSKIEVVYGLTNRTKDVKLAEHIDEGELRRELDRVRRLSFSSSEIDYLRSIKNVNRNMFSSDYLEFLRGLRLPEYFLKREGGNYRLEFSGKWCEAIYWETLALSIINELYFRSLMKKMTLFEQDVAYAEGRLRMAGKIKKIREHPDITFTDFGTRRRFSRDWQKYVVLAMSDELPGQFLGTSNTKLAMDLGLVLIGTSAHELFMVVGALLDIGSANKHWLKRVQDLVLAFWWEEYGQGLSIALTDTFGSAFFFRNMTQGQARVWKGLRQDSGYPKVFARRAIEFYKRNGIDPLQKLIVFSDGLDAKSIVSIADYCRDRIRCTFGWGTDLTNDLGFKTLSLVVKAIGANGKGTVKLSDNLAKAIGNPADIERYKESAGYGRRHTKDCRS